MTKFIPALLLGTSLLATPVLAEGHSHHNHHNHNHHGAHGLSVSGGGHDGHIHGNAVPAGIMGDHIHSKGSWMVSYTYMMMEMDGNRDGTDELNPLDISGDFANVTGVGPATLRIVPTEMTMEMHMLGAMYGVTDKLTLMAMANYLRREMDHITFAGADADLEIGRFTTRTSGWGDTKLAALYGLTDSLVLKGGVSLPTGSIDEEDDILNPMGVRQTVRVPYAMQLGSGTYDFEPAVTYTDSHGKWGYGAQYSAMIRLGENDEEYTLGDKHMLNVWGSYRLENGFTPSLRLAFETEDDIDGNDSNIAGPVQTANPDNYGGERDGWLWPRLCRRGTAGWTSGKGRSHPPPLPGPQRPADGTRLRLHWPV